MTDTAPIPVCGIGASAGGIEALQQFFGALPTDLGLAYVVIVHLAPDRKSELPNILARATAMPVAQVADHDQAKLLADHVYVIAPDRKLEITDTSVSASPFEQPRGQRNAIDLFFRSLAITHGDGFAVVLSGTGSDGALGAKAIKEGGGLVLVQDPRDAAHGAMPRAVISGGIADVVRPARELAGQLAELSRQKRRIQPAVQAAESSEPIPEDEERALRSVFELLRKRTGHDFSKYKRSTVLRRLARRMQLAQQLTIQEYLVHLRANAGEVQGLLNDLLISVTMFFRDPDAWRALETRVIRRLVEEENDQIRVWVPGCATGEEAYSLAMLFHEEFDRRNVRRNLVIFASDVDEAAITVARDGLYPRAISADVSEERLARFFRAEDEHYRVQSEIRDHLVFAVHSLLRDPPFSRLHLISCRNLMIYLDHDLQEHVMAIFRYASRDDGYVFLGASETANDELFETIDAKHRIFHVRDDPAHDRPELPAILASAGGARFRTERAPALPARSTAAEMHVAALENVAPPSVLVDERWNVVHLSPTASRFLQQSGGPLARRLTDLVRAELRDDLHLALHRAVEQPEPQLSPFVAVAFNGTSHRVAVLATQRRGDSDAGVRVLVTFLDGGELAGEATAVTDHESSDETVRELRDKLRQAERRIETMRDDHFLTNEDLRAANEELQSLNEEYRSTTEELETSKEELQSINEELQTVNNELKLKLEDVSRTHADLENFIAAADVAMLFLDREMRIKRFTPKLAEIFNIKTRDYDRPIGDLTHALDYSGFHADAEQLLRDASKPIERETRSAAGRSFFVRLSAYRQTNGHDVDGIVITFVDITEIKRVEVALRESEERLASELEIMRDLHRLTVEVAKVPTLHDALQFLLTAAVSLHRADFGNVQLLDPPSGRLRMVVHHGFAPAFIEQFQSVADSDDTACGRALRSRQTCQISDVEVEPSYVDYRAAAAEAGYRAAQSTPLFGVKGEILGILSVHFKEPHAFTQRDKQLADLLGHQAASLIAMRMHQQELADINDTLRRRTSELESSRQKLAAQADELIEHDRHREDFLAALGHELRNPMSAIQSAVSLLSVNDERSRRAQAVLERQTRHMTRLINDLLDMTRIKHGRLRLERMPVDVQQCALAAIETQRPAAETKGLRIEYDFATESTYVDADPERLGQIFDNLLRNAVAYTERGTITVAIRRESRQASVSIRDTGIGVEVNSLETLFEPFTQAGKTRDRHGLGLGLALVKNLVEAHGGTITGHSAGVGEGTEFVFTVPLAEPPVHGRTSSGIPTVAVGRRILVVDDQRDVADTFGSLLESLGQEVRVAHSGDDALVVAREFRPAVAFLDLAMPGMSGVELARRLRDESPGDGMTLVAVTGFGQQYQTDSAASFDHRLLKPVTAEQAAALLNSLA